MSTIYSIFGTCEAAAANVMIEQGKLTRIERSEIPEAEATNAHGQDALFAVIVPDEHDKEFDELCKEMRS